jgi:hypothetical protein
VEALGAQDRLTLERAAALLNVSIHELLQNRTNPPATARTAPPLSVTTEPEAGHWPQQDPQPSGTHNWSAGSQVPSSLNHDDSPMNFPGMGTVRDIGHLSLFVIDDISDVDSTAHHHGSDYQMLPPGMASGSSFAFQEPNNIHDSLGPFGNANDYTALSGPGQRRYVEPLNRTAEMGPARDQESSSQDSEDENESSRLDAESWENIPIIDPLATSAGTNASEMFWLDDQEAVQSEGIRSRQDSSGDSKALSQWISHDGGSVSPSSARQKSRRPFQDESLRQETSKTRGLKACVRCRMQKVRVREFHIPWAISWLVLDSWRNLNL